VALGVEMLGDYEKEAFDTGRGIEGAQERRGGPRDPERRPRLRKPVDAAPSRRSADHPRLSRNVRKLEVIQAVQDLILGMPGSTRLNRVEGAASLTLAETHRVQDPGALQAGYGGTSALTPPRLMRDA
jgi:hypothetical protein